MRKSEALQILEQKIRACDACTELAEWRNASNGKYVPGTGNPNADVMVIGEGPGKDEELQGLPFVGRAGQLLTKILEAAGWSREQVFIANIVKCRPPNNREPTPEEAKNCRKFLEMQIRCVDPKWILCFGKVASVYLLGFDPGMTIGSLRGEIRFYQGRSVICTYHPSYALRQPSAKAEIWKDLQPCITALQRHTGSV